MAVTMPSRTRTAFHPLSVAAVERLCEDAAALTFEVPDGLAADYDFRPGQSLVLRRTVDGHEERRNYSICAPAGAPPRIGVRRIPDGLFSAWLVDEVRPGQVIEVSTPTGSFTPGPDAGGEHVFIAAGSGITPVLSIASTVVEQGGSVSLLYGNRRSATVMFAEELADLKDRHPTRVRLAHVLSREPRESELFTGRLDGDRLRTLLPLTVPLAAVDHWWLCGPYTMVTDARQVLAELGVPRARIHQELFYVGEEPPPPVTRAETHEEDRTCEATVVLDGRSSAVPLPPDTTVLEGAQRFRPDLPFACKGGVCGTCRARVVEGAVRMRRNFALEDEEVAAGFVLTCQSVPETARITVDYDH